MKTRVAAAAFLCLSAVFTLWARAESPATPVMSDYYYFTCNATGWELNDQTRLRCLDSFCIDLALEYEVTEPWMVTDHDTCSLVKTDAYNGWGTRSAAIGAYVESPDGPARVNQLEVPAVARFYGSGTLAVKYPALGTYRVWVTRARAAFSITPVVQAPPAP